ncbi:ATP-binding protein [Geothrix campi]|uniref:ATP-binding protein n=1 Tax=Geothrix campi TaxID=2966450 RepID=UPI002147EB62|nr:ATP-binding protein [Geothrix sp. SG10]
MAIQIKKAVRERVYLKVAVGGPTGSGKTWGAIGVAKGLAPTGKVLVIDTENRSASYYAGTADSAGAWDFDVVEIEAPFTTQKYLEGLKAAIDNGYEAVVIDSLTHEWAASGGILDQKSQKDARGGNSFTNWNDMKQLHNKFVETLLQSKIHVVCTLRSKMEYALEQDDKGKSSVRKIGLAPISSDGMEYEFGVFFDVDRATHHAIATKDRTGLFEGRSIPLGTEVGQELRAWRDSGAELSPEPNPAPAPATATHGTATPAAPAASRATTPRAQGAAQPAAQGAVKPAVPTNARERVTPRPTQDAAKAQTASSAVTNTSTGATSQPISEPPADWVAAMVELSEVSLGMEEKTRKALIADFEAEGRAAMPALKEEITKLRFILHPDDAPTTAGGVIAQMDPPEASPVSQEASDFVDGVDPLPTYDTDEAGGGISAVQYEALNQLIGAFKIDRDCLRSYMAKAGHLLPGKNGPTLARMKAEEFVKLREKLCNQKIAAKGETWSARYVRIVNETKPTTYQPLPAVS